MKYKWRIEKIRLLYSRDGLIKKNFAKKGRLIHNDKKKMAINPNGNIAWKIIAIKVLMNCSDSDGEKKKWWWWDVARDCIMA